MPKTRMNVTCAHCGNELHRTPHRVKRAGTKGPLAGLSFCDRECQKRHFRFEHDCSWPGCDKKTLIVSQRHRIKHHSTYFCHSHLDLMREHLGAGTTATLARRKFLAGEPLGHRRATGKFVRFVVFELARGRCASCDCRIDRNAFFVDHRSPIFEGGETSLNNLQSLCRSCHLAKTAGEQKRVNASRWAKDRMTVHIRSMTHIEKDALIQRLLGEIEVLKSQIGEERDDHATPRRAWRGEQPRR